RRHTMSKRDWSSDVCSSDLVCWQVQIASISRRPNALRIVMPAQRISFLSLVGVASLAGLVLASCSTQAGGDGDEASTTVVATTTARKSVVQGNGEVVDATGT